MAKQMAETLQLRKYTVAKDGLPYDQSLIDEFNGLFAENVVPFQNYKPFIKGVLFKVKDSSDIYLGGFMSEYGLFFPLNHVCGNALKPEQIEWYSYVKELL